MADNGSETASPGMAELGRAECLRLMADAGLARVVMSADCIPVAFPVTVAVVDDAVVFATDPGSKLDAAVRGDVVTVEADAVDRVYHTGWSVLVTGVAHLVTDPPTLRSARRALGVSWVPQSSSSVVRIPATRVSGRRITWDAVAQAGTT